MARRKSSGRSRSQQRFTRQARDEAFLRFNPERSALRSALADAADQLQSEVSTARGTAAGVRQAAREADPQLRSTYSTAQQAVGQGQQDLLQATGGSPYAPAAARDAIGTQRRLAESMANALAETTQRGTDAQAGASFAINQAESRYGRNVDKVQTRLGDLSQEEGRYVSGRLGDLLGEQAKRVFQARQNRASRAVTKRGQDLSHQDRVAAQQQRAADARKNARANPTLPGGTKPAPLAARTKFRNDVAKAVATIRPFVGKLDRHKAAALFLTGASAPKEGTPGQPGYKAAVKIPAIPQSVLTTALDIAYDKKISHTTARSLHTAGIIIKELPYPVGATPRPAAPRRSPRSAIPGLGAIPS